MIQSKDTSGDDPGSLESIGQLEVRSSIDGLHSFHHVYLRKETLIGRDPQSCQIVFNDLTVSNKHVKIYSISYDQSNCSNIKPLIYAEDLSSNGTYWNGSLVGKTNGAVLLSDGDVLRISQRISLLFHTEVDCEMHEPSSFQESEMKHFQDSYRISSRQLGSGAQGNVYMAVKQQTGRQLACKVIDLSKIRQREFSKLRALKTSTITSKMDQFTSKLMREVDILKDINHPNIIRLEKVYHTDRTVYIFEELITGGDLFSYIESRGGYLHEATAGVIIRQVLEALDYLHSRDIVHRDLKPDNLLITSLSDGARVVLTDFGSAIIWKPLEGERARRMETLTGTLEYVAPEVQGLNSLVKEKGYTKAVDMWSLGCVTAALLTGASPFDISELSHARGNTDEAILHAAAECRLHKLSITPEWERVGRRPKAFVRGLLTLDESGRMTAQEALNHEWFTNKYHKTAFDAVYSKSIKDWESRIKYGVIVEEIRPRNESKKLFKDRLRLALPRKMKPKHSKPIEPHYQPFHKNFSALLSPARMKGSLPMIAEVSEEWQSLIDGSSQLSSIGLTRATSSSPLEPQDMSCQELLSVESLKLNDDNKDIKQYADKFSFFSNPESGPPSNADASCIEMDWVVEDDINQLEQEANSNLYNDETSQGSSLLEYEQLLSQRSKAQVIQDHIPTSTLNGKLKRPAKPTQSNDRLSTEKPEVNRKRRLIFDIDEDKEVSTPIVKSNEENLDDHSISFTSVNRRHSAILGDMHGKGGGLILDYSRQELFRATHNMLTSKGGDTSTKDHFLDTSQGGRLDDSTDEDDINITQPHNNFHRLSNCFKRRRSTVYDPEETAIYAEASKDNRLFRTARSFGESVAKKRLERTLKSQQVKLSADLTSSIRIAAS